MRVPSFFSFYNHAYNMTTTLQHLVNVSECKQKYNTSIGFIQEVCIFPSKKFLKGEVTLKHKLFWAFTFIV